MLRERDTQEEDGHATMEAETREMLHKPRRQERTPYHCSHQIPSMHNSKEEGFLFYCILFCFVDSVFQGMQSVVG